MPDEIPSKKDMHLDEESKRLWADLAKTDGKVCKEDAETVQCCVACYEAYHAGLVIVAFNIPSSNGLTIKTVKLNYCPECGKKLWDGK